MALGMALDHYLIGPNLLELLKWNCWNINGPQRMKPTVFGDPLPLYVVPSAVQSYQVKYPNIYK